MTIRYLIDTDWVVDYFHNKEPVASKLDDLRQYGIAISVITLAELYEGALYTPDPAASEQILLDFISNVGVLGISEGVCKIFGDLRGKLRKQRNMIGDFDILIASTAIYYKIPLCTKNRRHYDRIKELDCLYITEVAT